MRFKRERGGVKAPSNPPKYHKINELQSLIVSSKSMMVVSSYCFLYYNMYAYIIIYNTQAMKSLKSVELCVLCVIIVYVNYV